MGQVSANRRSPSQQPLGIVDFGEDAMNCLHVEEDRSDPVSKHARSLIYDDFKAKRRLKVLCKSNDQD